MRSNPLQSAIAYAILRYDNDHVLSSRAVPGRHHYGEADAVLDTPEMRQLVAGSTALAAVREFADTLDEMGENAARPADRQMYQAIAADIRKHATPPAAP